MKPLLDQLYSSGDMARFADEANESAEKYRTPWRRDYARLIHSPSFRRLQGKTQVFPGYESDFYRNRLTHSLEVAQIAKSIAIRINATEARFRRKVNKIEPDLVEFAGLAHDLGHPPFGHNGEEALDECMKDCGGFEGNAQTLRIVSRIEKKWTQRLVGGSTLALFDGNKDLRCGLNLTYRSLASLLKYDEQIPNKSNDRLKKNGLVKGYYADESVLVEKIKTHVLNGKSHKGQFKTIECSIMDVADDIAYSTYDLEDNFKAGFLTPMGLFALNDDVYKSVADKIIERGTEQYRDKSEFISSINSVTVKEILYTIFEALLFDVGADLKRVIKNTRTPIAIRHMLVAAEIQGLSHKIANDGYQRTKFTSNLVGSFLGGVEIVPHDNLPQLDKVRLDFDTFLQVEVLKNITYYAVIKSPSMQVVEYRGKGIVTSIFDALAKDADTRLMPDDFRVICQNAPNGLKRRTICDFIAGMTDRYAFEFYGRLHGVNPLTMHKPL